MGTTASNVINAGMGAPDGNDTVQKRVKDCQRDHDS